MNRQDITIEQLKELLFEHCHLQCSPEEVTPETPLFGPEGLGLDSIDALELIVRLEESYQTPALDPEQARTVLATLASIQHWLHHLP